MEEFNQSIDNVSGQGIALDDRAQTYLRSAAKWAKFLSILAFIGTAFIVIIAFTGGMFMNNFGGGFGFASVLTYLISGVLYLFIGLYLYRFADKANMALDTQDSFTLSDSMEQLKKFFKFSGILAIIGIGFMVIGFLAALIFGAAAGGF